MSVDMYLGAAKSQAASAQKMADSQIAGYEDCQKATSSFTVASPELKGAAYDNAKEYFSAVLYPMTRGGILLSEAVAAACQKFPDDYVAKVDSGDLKESDLREKIAQLTTQMDDLADLQARLHDLLFQPNEDGTLDSSLASKMASNDSLMRKYEASKKKLEDQLEKLLDFHATSPAIFDDIAALAEAIDLGSAQAGKSFNSATGRFSIPKKGSMAWVKTINNSWAERERLEIERTKLDELENQEVGYQFDEYGNVIGVFVNGKYDAKMTKYVQGQIELENQENLKALGSGFIDQWVKNNGAGLIRDIFGFDDRFVNSYLSETGEYQKGQFWGNLISIAQAGAEFYGGGLWLIGGTGGALAAAPVTGGGSTVAIPAVVGSTLAVWSHGYVVLVSAASGLSNGGGSSEIKHTYNSIKDAPKYPEGFKPRKNGTKNHKVTNKKALDDLRKVEKGTWKKVYKDGFDANGNKISIHYFQSKSGKVFNVKVKNNWSNK